MSCVNLPYEIISHILVNFIYTEYHQKCFLISKKINSIVKTNDLIKEKHIFDNRLSMLKEDDNNNSDKTDLINSWQKFYFYNWGNKYIKYFSLFNQKYNILKSWHEGDIVDVSAVSKGKGFAGVMKRHGFAGQRASHGAHKVHRKPGAIGQCATPSRVFQGKKMPGRMGSQKTTIMNLKVVRTPKNVCWRFQNQ